MNKKNIVITHKNCPDGFLAAWVAWTKFKNNASYIGEHPGQKRLLYMDKLMNKNVYIFDISFPFKFIRNLEKITNKLVVIDHHPGSNYLNTIQNKNFIYNEKYSAAYLTWKYFYPKKLIPQFIKLISDNDTGTWKMKYSKELSIYLKYKVKLKLKNDHFKKTTNLVSKTKLNKAIETGIIYKEYENQLIESIAKIAVKKQWHKYNVLIANANVPHLGGKIATFISQMPNIDIGIVYRKISDTEILFTMRSNKKNIDLNKIASKYGGGGHKGAASFVFYTKEKQTMY